jgi:hypothetical protein
MAPTASSARSSAWHLNAAEMAAREMGGLSLDAAADHAATSSAAH